MAAEPYEVVPNFPSIGVPEITKERSCPHLDLHKDGDYAPRLESFGSGMPLPTFPPLFS